MSSTEKFLARILSIRHQIALQTTKTQFEAFYTILRCAPIPSLNFCCHVENCNTISKLLGLLDSGNLEICQKVIYVLTNLTGQSTYFNTISHHHPIISDSKPNILIKEARSQFLTQNNENSIQTTSVEYLRNSDSNLISSSTFHTHIGGCMFGVSDDAHYSRRVLYLSDIWRESILHSSGFLDKIKNALYRFGADFTTSLCFQQHLIVFLSDLYRDFDIFTIEYLTYSLDSLDPLISLLVTFLYHTDDICLECACITLSLFSYYGARSCQKILDMVDVDTFLSLLSHPSSTIVWPSLIICANILSGNICQIQVLLDYNLIPRLKILEATTQNKNIKYCVFLVAVRICLGSYNQIKLLTSSGIFEIAKETFNDAHIQIKVQISWMFITVLGSEEDCDKTIREHRSIYYLRPFDMLCEMLKLCDPTLFGNNIRRSNTFVMRLLTSILSIRYFQNSERLRGGQIGPEINLEVDVAKYIHRERKHLIPFIRIIRTHADKKIKLPNSTEKASPSPYLLHESRIINFSQKIIEHLNIIREVESAEDFSWSTNL